MTEYQWMTEYECSICGSLFGTFVSSVAHIARAHPAITVHTPDPIRGHEAVTASEVDEAIRSITSAFKEAP